MRHDELAEKMDLMFKYCVNDEYLHFNDCKWSLENTGAKFTKECVPGMP